jgi:hypothetical protein
VALATLAACALPIALGQRAVWERTLAYVPPFNHYYPNDVPPELRLRIEHPDRPPTPGFF